MASGKVAQGDILIMRVEKCPTKEGGYRITEVGRDADGALVLGRGERSGHRHALFGKARMFRAERPRAMLLRDDLYVGHVVVSGARGAVLRHEEHGPIKLKPGTYVVRRQRQFTARDVGTTLVRD